jgi:hypothetical protein
MYSFGGGVGRVLSTNIFLPRPTTEYIVRLHVLSGKEARMEEQRIAVGLVVMGFILTAMMILKAIGG